MGKGNLVRPGFVRGALLGLVLLGLLSVTLYWARPYYDWDLLPYVAVARVIGGASPETAREEAYALARETVPPVEYGWLVAANGYRRITAEDPRAFAEQLQFYTVKPVYPALILLLDRLGLHPVDASLAISRAAYLAIGLVLLAWAGTLLHPMVAVLTTWGAMSLPLALDLARAPTPDALSNLVVLAALWQIFRRGRFTSGAFLLLGAVAVRPDNLLWLLAVAGYGAASGRVRAAAAFGAAGMAFYVTLVRISGNVGWTVLFYHSFVDRLEYPVTSPPVLSVGEYVRALLRESHPVYLPPFAMIFGVLGLALLAGHMRSRGWRDPTTGFLIVTAVFGIVHWLVFPEGDRFLTASYLVIVVLLVHTLVGGRPPGATAPAGGQAAGASHRRIHTRPW